MRTNYKNKATNIHTRTGLALVAIPEALGKLSIGGPLPTYVEDKKRSSPPQIVEFECIQTIV